MIWLNNIYDMKCFFRLLRWKNIMTARNDTEIEPKCLCNIQVQTQFIIFIMTMLFIQDNRRTCRFFWTCWNYRFSYFWRFSTLSLDAVWFCAWMQFDFARYVWFLSLLITQLNSATTAHPFRLGGTVPAAVLPIADIPRLGGTVLPGPAPALKATWASNPSVSNGIIF